MANGGKRPGAGRKKGSQNKKTIEKTIARAHMVNKFLEDWDGIINTMRSLALGKTKVVKVQGKLVEVYTRAPDSKMLQVIVETVIGKPKTELTGVIDMKQMEESNKVLRAILSK